MAPNRNKSSSSSDKDKGKKDAPSRSERRRSRSRDRSPLDPRSRERETLQEQSSEEPVVNEVVPAGAMVVPAAVLQGLAESVARTEEAMKRLREQQNAADYGDELQKLRRSQANLEDKAKGFKLKSESNRIQFDAFADIKGFIKVAQDMFASHENLTYDNIRASSEALAKAEKIANDRLALIEKVDNYGAGGWTVGTKFLLSKERGTGDPEDAKLWEAAVKQLSDEKKEKEKEKERQKKTSSFSASPSFSGAPRGICYFY